jgi:flagellin-specific chaperone FliS
MNMHVVLIQQRCTEVLKSETGLMATMSQENKTEMINKARSVIILCLNYQVLREVAKETTLMTMYVVKVGFFVYDQVIGS